jgi:adenylyltransferase/sulfurtransferase
LILGEGDALVGRLLLYDALTAEFREVKVRKNLDCPVCSDHPIVTELIDYQQFCGLPSLEAIPVNGTGELMPA